MVTFLQPAFLLFLPLVAFVCLRWLQMPRGAIRVSTDQFFPANELGRTRRSRWAGVVLRGFGLTLFLLALARPVWPDPGSRVPVESLSLAIVVDVSRSMDNRDLFWDGEVLSRLDGVKRVFRWFVQGGIGLGGATLPGREHDALALVTFATHPETTCPLTLDRDSFVEILDGAQVRSLVVEATSNPGDALAWATSLLQKAPTKNKAIVLLSDGEANVAAPALRPRQAAQLAGNLGIPIYALDVNGEPDSPDAKSARQTLRDLAELTKGKYFEAFDGKCLTEAAEAIDKLERSRVESYQYREHREGFPWLLLAGVVCWLSTLAFEMGPWRTSP